MEFNLKSSFCSGLFHHFGKCEPVTTSDLTQPARKALQQMPAGPIADYMPHTGQTEGVLRGLAALNPETPAVMHDSSYIGKIDKRLINLAGVIEESFNHGQ